jgi:hypothetical protein
VKAREILRRIVMELGNNAIVDQMIKIHKAMEVIDVTWIREVHMIFQKLPFNFERINSKGFDKTRSSFMVRISEES